uniref:MYND-type domain-containing protein n=1 Tax=Anopheles maculatus TaxID=74869 RepID=A0A182STS8_9DIPT
MLCNVCLEYRADMLTLCKDCHQTAYCSEEHRLNDRDNHSKWCDGLRINFFYDGTPFQTSIPENVYLNIHFNDDETLPKPVPKDTFGLASVMLLKDIQNGDSEPGRELAQHIEEFKLAGMFSHVGTILHVLQKVSLLEDVQSELNIFVLGAEKEHLLFNIITQAAFFAHLPNLRHLRLCFIGPNVDKQPKSVGHFAGNRKVEIVTYRYLYHKLPKTVKLPKPHLAIAFNCGFNEFGGTSQQTWDKTIRQILNIPNVPFAFTSYTLREASEDACIVEMLANFITQSSEEIVYVVRNAVNPFRQPIPLRNPNLDDEDHVLYYENGYLSVCLMQSE